MKTIFSLIFSILLGTATAQTKLYDPKELKQAADYYFSTLFYVHPNPYYFYGKCKFNKLKNKIYKDLDKPLSKNDFLLTIGQINSYLDMHSTIPVQGAFDEIALKSITDKMKEATFYLLKDSIDNISFFQDFSLDSLKAFLKERNIDKDSMENSIFVFPIVEIRDNELFLLGDSINNIIEINGISTKAILFEINKYINRKLNPETNLILMNQYVNEMILGKYNINPPFRIKFAKNNKEEIIKGMTLLKWSNELLSVYIASVPKYSETPYTYEIYPENAIAIFHIQTFLNEEREYFLEKLEKFKNEVNIQNIKYIFYDLTMNGGGNHFGTEALEIIRHDTIYFRYKETTHIPDSGIKKGKINRAVSVPNHNDDGILDDRILFVLQSAATGSGADYFCRIIAENKLGVLVGEPTGELTKTFSYASPLCTMPHTFVNFHIATTLVDFSDYFKSLTTEPDIYWNLRNVKEFTEQELLQIINAYKNKEACIN